MNDLENCGLLELPVLCKTPPQIAEFLSGKMFVPATAAAAWDSRLYMPLCIYKTFHCSSGLWPTDWSRGGGRNYNQGMEITWEASAVSHSKV